MPVLTQDSRAPAEETPAPARGKAQGSGVVAFRWGPGDLDRHAEASENLVAGAPGLQLASTFPSPRPYRGSYLSRPVTLTEPFRAAVMSWNAETPGGSTVEVQARAWVGQRWSQWFSFGRWGSEVSPRSEPGQKEWLGRLEVDTLRLRRPGSSLQLRVFMEAGQGGLSPALRLLAAALHPAERTVPEAASLGPAVAVEVPPRSQMLENVSLARRMCSPTCLAMVMEFWGVCLETATVATGVYDHAAGIYGNWAFNVAYAATVGFEAWVGIGKGLHQLYSCVAAGQPVVASLRFRRGELAGAPIARTAGHLVVVTGFTELGDVVVNDPAAPDLSSVRRTYSRHEFERAWLERGSGAVYIVLPLRR